MDDPEAFLRSLFSTAVAAASDFSMIPGLIPRTRGRVRVLAAGKAAAGMAAAIEAAPPDWLRRGQMDGLVVTPASHDLPLTRFEVMIAAHPVPDVASARAGERMLALAAELEADDLLVALVSGGASALLAAPVEGLTLEDEIALNRSLLVAGLPIAMMNAARARVSRIKSGGLARAAWPATVTTFVVSDVPGDDPALIGSGPTLAPESLELDASILRLLPDFGAVVPSPLPQVAVHVLATGRDALVAAEKEAARHGLAVVNLGADLQGEARALGQEHAALVRELAGGSTPTLVLSGGETTVSVVGSGRGGRNTEYLAALMTAIGSGGQVWAIAADTDGLDGTGPAAGAVLRPDSLERARALGLDVASMIAANDTLGVFMTLDDLVVTGPTRTNVNDFRAVLVLPS